MQTGQCWHSKDIPAGEKAGARASGLAGRGRGRRRRRVWKGVCARAEEWCTEGRGSVPAGAPGGAGPRNQGPSGLESPVPALCPGNEGLPRPQGPRAARPCTRAASPKERTAQGAHPVTQPSTATVSGRGPRAGHCRAASPEAGAGKGGRGPAGWGLGPAAPGALPGSARAQHGRTCARKARRRPPCARPPARGRPGGARGRSPGSGASASRSSRATAAAGAGSPWRGRAPAAFAPRPARLRAPPAPPPAAPLGIARAGRGLGRPGPAPRWLRPGGRGDSRSRPPPARAAPA